MCGFIAQLEEHRTSIAEVTGSNPVEALIFSGFFFPIAKIGKFTAMVILHFGELSRKIGKDIHPVYTSWKIGSNIKPKESKSPLVNQQCVVYHFKCDLCDADYVGYTCRQLFQRIEEHKGSAIGKHIRDQHGRDPSDISLRFKILRKCQSKFDCLIYEMLFTKELKPTLNTQSDSIRAKLFFFGLIVF